MFGFCRLHWTRKKSLNKVLSHLYLVGFFCFEEVFVVCRIIYDNPLLSPHIFCAFTGREFFHSVDLSLALSNGIPFLGM